MRDTSSKVPSMIKSETLGNFEFKLCQNDWKLVKGDDKYLQPTSPT